MSHTYIIVQATGESVTVFSLVFAEVSEEQAAAARNGVRRSKMLRHPNFVRYVDTFEVFFPPMQSVVYGFFSVERDLLLYWRVARTIAKRP